jgi:nucleotide-binding universal stress UspA family protein
MSDANVSAIPTKILVPIDFSPSSHVAIETATELAEKFHAEIILLHVLPESAADEAKALAEKNFAISQAALDAKGIKASAKIVEDHDVAGYILEFAEEAKIDLVVISTHGVSGWYPCVFGSIAEKIVKLIHTPIMLLRTEKPETSVKIPHGRLMEWW